MSNGFLQGEPTSSEKDPKKKTSGEEGGHELDYDQEERN